MMVFSGRNFDSDNEVYMMAVVVVLLSSLCCVEMAGEAGSGNSSALLGTPSLTIRNDLRLRLLNFST